MKPFGVTFSNQATSIATARFDLSAFIEQGVPVSIMHRSFASLKQISAGFSLNVASLPIKNSTDAVRVSGNYSGNSALQVDAVWVDASSTKYRKSLEARNLAANLIDSCLPSGLHADHIVNRASLREMIKGGHKPWVMLFEVPASSNTNFGSKYERSLPKFDVTTPQVHLSAAHIFKLYSTDWPKNSNEFEQSLNQISAQINNANVIEDIRSLFGGFFGASVVPPA